MRQKAAAVTDRSRLDDATRHRIEQAVLEVFAEREFHSVGLIEIARSASISLQTIYKYYGSKEALLFSTLDLWMGRLSLRMIDHLQGIEDYKERLRKVFWVTLDFFETNPKVAQMLMSSVYTNTWQQQQHYQNPALFGPFMKILSEGRARGIFDDSVEEKYLLDFFFGVLERQVQMYVHRGMKESITTRSNALFEMVWRAIAKPSPESRPR